MKLSDFLNEGKYDNLSDGAQEMLGYLVHDKNHVFNKHSRDRDMDEVLSKHSEKYNKPLYRGVSAAELKLIETGKPIPYYTSYSESKEIAKNFGTVVTMIPPMTGFCYWMYQKTVLEDLKKSDKKEYNAVDGAELLGTALHEKEWVFDLGITFAKADGDHTYTCVPSAKSSKPKKITSANVVEIGDRVSFSDDACRRCQGEIVAVVKEGKPIPNVPGFDFNSQHEDSRPGEPAYKDLLFVKDDSGHIHYVMLFSHQRVERA